MNFNKNQKTTFANKEQRLYYSISEVARMFDINESTLRYWEKEFPTISPRKNKNGMRLYQQADIESIRMIHHLLKERGMTVAGARQKLKDNKETTIQQVEIVKRLKAIKEELLAMQQAFEELDTERNKNN